MRLILISLLLSSCSPHKPPVNASQGAPKGITLMCAHDCTDGEKSKIKAIEDKLNKTIRSQCFADYIRARRTWNLMKRETPETLLRKLREPITLVVRYFYDPAWWVYGYETAGDPVVHLNRNSIARQSLNLCAEASIAAHEAAHVLGFMHRGNVYDEFNSWTTAPYIVNHAFDPRSEDFRNGGCCL